jgi:hypothetical protein
MANNPALIAAFKDACATIEVQAATARFQGLIKLAEELERNVRYYRETIAKAEAA